MTTDRDWTRILARRILARIPRFILDTSIEADHHAFIPDADQVIGKYVPDASETSRVVVCEDGILYHDDQWQWLQYSEVERVTVDIAEGKTHADQIIVYTIDDQPRRVTIPGGEGKFRDVFEFSRFMARASKLRRPA